jgi:hypothetical protein
MRHKDIIKGVVYDRGTKTLNGETRHFALIALIVASDVSIVDPDTPEYIIMGQCNLIDSLKELTNYECPYNFGDISNAIIGVSQMVPDDLEQLEP